MDDWRTNLKRNWLYMMTATLLSIFLWIAVSADTVAQETIPTELGIALTDPDYVEMGREPSIQSVSVVFTGRAGDLASLSLSRPQIFVQVDSVPPSLVKNIELTPEMVVGRDGRILSDVRALNVTPNLVRLHFQPKLQKVVPVAARTRIGVADGFVLSDTVRVDPPSVAVSGPQGAVGAIDSIATTPIVRENLRESTSVEVMLEQPDASSRVTLSSSSVRVTVSVEPRVERVFRGIPVGVVGANASQLRIEPSLVDVRLSGPKGAVEAVRPENLLPKVELVGTRDFGRPLQIILPDLGPFVDIEIEPDSARAIQMTDGEEG